MDIKGIVVGLEIIRWGESVGDIGDVGEDGGESGVV